MKKLKLALCAVLVLAFLGCAGMSVGISNNANTVLQNSAISTVGYLIVKNNPQFRNPMAEWYLAFQGVNDLGTVQTMFQDGITKLSQSVSHDPFLTMQIQNALSLLEINVKGPQIELDIGKYQGIVDAFMMGVMSVPYTI